VTLTPTASQTVGPFSQIGCAYLGTDGLPLPGPGAASVVVRGKIFDGEGNVVPDFMLEIWQPRIERSETGAPAAFGRIMPSDDGSFAFRTAYSPASTLPYVVVLIFMRGLLKPLLTRMYLPDDPRNDTEAALSLVPAQRRATLIARPVVPSKPAVENSLAVLEWDVRLQGADETVFFEW
jgi:protocatechuate 3,4-dioxygenase alpha subunit